MRLIISGMTVTFMIKFKLLPLYMTVVMTYAYDLNYDSIMTIKQLFDFECFILSFYDN